MKKQFDVPCPVVWCMESGPHEHEVCEVCGSPEYGNAFTRCCYEHWLLSTTPQYVGYLEQIHAAALWWVEQDVKVMENR